MRPPKIFQPRGETSPLAALEHELVAERAGTLIRMTRRFEAMLGRLGNMEAGNPARALLVAETGRALWMLAVQREAMGLSGGEALVRAYNIPAEVRVAAGIVTKRAAVPRRR